MRGLPTIFVCLLGFVGIATATIAPSALADGSPLPFSTTPAVQAYVEQVPTNSGAQPADSGPTKSGSVPPAVARQISQSGGADAAVLKRIAQSGPADRPLESAAGAVSTSLGPELSWLIAGLLAITAAAALGFGARQRRLRLHADLAGSAERGG